MQTTTLVGIDEAGYGPLLGPLVVSAVAFDVPVAVMQELDDPAQGPNLWAMLKSCLVKKPSRRNARLAVADSKVLYNSGDGEQGLKLLERAALTFLAQNGHQPATLRDLLCIVCPEVCDQLGTYPWYGPGDLALPVHCSSDDLGTQRNALAAAMKRAGVTFRGAWVQVLPEGHFNQFVQRTRNKSTVLFMQAARLMQRIADDLGPRPLRIWCDRQGGRVGYRESLMTSFPDAPLDVLEESPERSGYRLRHARGPWAVRFVMKGESSHLPIALASIYSKYIRELFMICFNRYWCAQIPQLRPTAGYYKDGQRFLADIEPFITAQRLDRQILVRSV